MKVFVLTHTYQKRYVSDIYKEVEVFSDKVKALQVKIYMEQNHIEGTWNHKYEILEKNIR